jgi:hypothetical protein
MERDSGGSGLFSFCLLISRRQNNGARNLSTDESEEFEYVQVSGNASVRKPTFEPTMAPSAAIVSVTQSG